MKKWKTNIVVKLFIAFLIFVNVSATIGSAICLYGMYYSGVYEMQEDDFRQERYNDMLYRCSVEALSDRGAGEKNIMYNSNFKYGIIKAESLDKLDLNNESTYEERNFSDKVKMDDLHIYSTRLTENTTFYFHHGLLGYAYAQNDRNENQVENDIDFYGYDKDNGILFCSSKERNYPINSITIEMQNEYYYFEYQPYSQDYMYIDGSGISDIVTWSEFPLTVFDGTRLDFSNWERVQIGERYIYPKDIKAFTGENFEYVNLDENNYYVDQGKVVTWGDETVGDNYFVVSYVQNPLKSYGNWWNEDLFVQWRELTSFFYTIKNYIIFICLGFAALSLITIIMLTYGVGHRKNTDEIVLRACDRLPLEVFTIFIGLLVGSFIYILDMLGFATYGDTQIPVIIICCCFSFLLVMWYYFSLVVRIKSKKFWDYTLVHKIGKTCRNFYLKISENMDILWKALLIMGGLAIIEGLVIIATNYEGEVEIVLWFVEKVILYALIIVGIIQVRMLKEGGKHLAQGDLSHQIDTKKMFWEFKQHGENLNKVGEGIAVAVEDRLKSERFKTELITNVSHDIRTPLTSIINYVDLLEKEDIDNENVKEYLEVLDRQSGRLKKLIEDLMEASKASTGNLTVNMEKLEAGVFMVQTVGEFEEKTAANQLELITVKPDEEIYIMADARHLWRVFDNLMNNICKYAQPGTRVYINLTENDEEVDIAFKNTSKYQLNISSEELMERFVRGDSSRNTEGSGLGLSIARSLTELIGGNFRLSVDGDFFKVELIFPKYKG